MTLQKLAERLDQVKRVFTASYYLGPGGWPEVAENLVTEVDCVVMFFCITCTICAVGSVIVLQLIRLLSDQYGELLCATSENRKLQLPSELGNVLVRAVFLAGTGRNRTSSASRALTGARGRDLCEANAVLVTPRIYRIIRFSPLRKINDHVRTNDIDQIDSRQVSGYFDHIPPHRHTHEARDGPQETLEATREIVSRSEPIRLASALNEAPSPPDYLFATRNTSPDPAGRPREMVNKVPSVDV
ncbi:hypothetical protein BIW11_11825 [Tropilaelaps mercedesae]|uniref:Uncharacterized protein n=1 Tax=Tropilaelaps mercedesae TaxID=418985 RepID=A0A1V9X9T2_9ACAR|nr:hypothetical protein BIW11_11825 [Tropilaelaps mercedesae]